MQILVVGCSYRTAPVAVRERMAFTNGDLRIALGQLTELPDISECMLVSTCNRVEAYAVTLRPEHAREQLRAFLVGRAKAPAAAAASSTGDGNEASGQLPLTNVDVPADVIYSYTDTEAVQHIFRVAASLDAMVVGEAQITGQVKAAFSQAAAAQSLGPILNRCMHRAFAAAKRVRNETMIARHPVSVSSVAVDLAARIFGELTPCTALIIGAGEMAQLAAQHLTTGGVGELRVVNRTHEKAVALAFQLGGKAQRFERLEDELLLADIVIASTAATDPVLTQKMVARVMRERKQRPLFLVDIAVPRNVEASVARVANVYCYSVDDLEAVVAENLRARKREIKPAERIVQAEVGGFAEWIKRQDAVPVIKELRARFQEVARAEARRTAQLLHLTRDEEQNALTAMADSIVNKLLHDPTVELKRHAQTPDGGLLGRAAQTLFHLNDQDGAGSSRRSDDGDST